jgi:hypothetical protein
MAAFLVLLTGWCPLFLAWRANRRTTLIHPLCWASAAWTAWLLALLLTAMDSETAKLVRYVALCLTGCAGVAVLGARRPGAGAWNFVVLALMVVLLLPIAEGLGALQLDPLRVVFLSATLAVGVLNYLPTRLATAMVCLAIGCGVEVMLLAGAEDARPMLERAAPFNRFLLALAPWAAFERLRPRRADTSDVDRIWLSFRDRYGLVWGQRTREQFNAAAAHSGWPVVLHWRGLRTLSGETALGSTMEDEMIFTLRALLKRFGCAEAMGEQAPGERESELGTRADQ